MATIKGQAGAADNRNFPGQAAAALSRRHILRPLRDIERTLHGRRHRISLEPVRHLIQAVDRAAARS